MGRFTLGVGQLRVILQDRCARRRGPTAGGLGSAGTDLFTVACGTT
jgi:hypothetical protein